MLQILIDRLNAWLKPEAAEQLNLNADDDRSSMASLVRLLEDDDHNDPV